MTKRSFSTSSSPTPQSAGSGKRSRSGTRPALTAHERLQQAARDQIAAFLDEVSHGGPLRDPGAGRRGWMAQGGGAARTGDADG